MKDERGAERFQKLAWLVGEWQGYGKFAKQNGYINKQYYYDIAGIFLVERTIDMFPPPELTTDFEIHQDMTIFYVDTATDAIKAKGFFVEQYVTSSTVHVSKDGNSIVVETSEVENGPPGMRTRITYTRQGENEFTGSFEITMPAEDFKVVEELTMSRVT